MKAARQRGSEATWGHEKDPFSCLWQGDKVAVLGAPFQLRQQRMRLRGCADVGIWGLGNLYSYGVPT